MIAKDARKNLGGTEVVSVGSVFAREIQGVQCYAVVAIVPDQDGKDWVPSEVILDTAQNYLAASINRLSLISSLEDVFARVQVFGTELALAKYCQKEWPSAHMDQVVTEMMRGLNCSVRLGHAECIVMFVLYLIPSPSRRLPRRAAHFLISLAAYAQTRRELSPVEHTIERMSWLTTITSPSLRRG